MKKRARRVQLTGKTRTIPKKELREMRGGMRHPSASNAIGGTNTALNALWAIGQKNTPAVNALWAVQNRLNNGNTNDNVSS